MPDIKEIMKRLDALYKVTQRRAYLGLAKERQEEFNSACGDAWPQISEYIKKAEEAAEKSR